MEKEMTTKEDLKEFFTRMAELSVRLNVGKPLEVVVLLKRMLSYSERYLLTSASQRQITKNSRDAIRENIRNFSKKGRTDLRKLEKMLKELKKEEVNCYICTDDFHIDLDEKKRQEELQKEIIDDDGYLYACPICIERVLKRKKIF